jgi:hypothetical protein
MYTYNNKYFSRYCVLDTILLCEVMQDFSQRCTQAFNLSIDHFWTLPSYALSACLKTTGVMLELITDKTMYDFVERAKRGGLCVAVQHFATTGDGLDYLKDRMSDNVSDKDIRERIYGGFKQYIYDLDMNNLYGSVQLLALPKRGFGWCCSDTLKQMESFFVVRKLELEKNGKVGEKWSKYFTDVDVEKIPDEEPLNSSCDESYGYFLEIDYHYPKRLHKDHSDFPLAPHNATISGKDLSEPAKKIMRELGKNPDKHTSQKLVATLHDGTNYVVHSATLDLYTALGLEVTKVHRAVRFVQSPFLKPWIHKCTEQRVKAAALGDAGGRAFWKLMINSCFGESDIIIESNYIN